MQRDLSFIGTISRGDIEKTVSQDPWKPLFFEEPPYSVVGSSPGYMLTMGSGNMSLATVAYGFRYVSGIDVFRHDFNSRNPEEPLVNIDHYIARSISPSSFAVFKTPPQNYHWPKPTDQILNVVPSEWGCTLNDMLRRRRE